jgi:ferritin-like metal-binding protein YciE
MKTLKDLFLDQLADMYDAERRVVKALPKMAEVSARWALAAIAPAPCHASSNALANLKTVARLSNP